MQITREDIKENVDLGAFNRGYHYFKDGDVDSYEVFSDTDEIVSLNASVNGMQKYEQDINITYKNKKVIISGKCSCPVRDNCKHIVAVCLQYMSDKKNENPSNKYDKWLDILSKVSSHKNFELYQSEPFITYRLFTSDTRTDTNDLKFYQNKFLKNGMINQGTLLNSDKYLFSTLYDNSKFEADIAIVEYCSGFFQKYGNKTTKLEGSLGYIVIEELIKTKRCFYTDNIEPLLFSDDEVSLDFTWEKVNENYELKIKNINDFEIIFTQPLLVIHKQRNKIQRVTTEMNSKFLEQLLEAPIIPHNKVLELCKLVEKNSKNISFSLPADLELNTIEVVPTIKISKDEINEWFKLSFNIEFDGKIFPIAPLVSGIIEQFDSLDNLPKHLNIKIEDDSYVRIDTEQLRPILNTIIALNDKKDNDGNIIMSSYESHLLGDFSNNSYLQDNELVEISQKLKNFDGIKKVEQSSCMTATLRDYQQDGINWLNFLFEFKFSGILADDMGLGKTIQTLTHLSRLKENGQLTSPCLIVMPTSLIANWKNEIKKFTPNLSVLSLHGQDRAKRFKQIHEYDILLTTYPLIVRDKEKFEKEFFLYIILDEAQKIKNPKTKMTQAIKELKSENRLALSGTPIENHLGELWSIFDFLMPNFLDTLSFFKNYYQTPIEKENDFEKQKLLNQRVKPFIIRRTKEIVAHELPPKSIIVKYTQFESKQSTLYESIRVTMEKKVREAVSSKGIGSSHITILDALLKLRQVCCDPSLVKIDEALAVQESAKLELFLDLIDELLSEGRKILVFSQFTSMLKIIEEKIIEKEINYSKLTGSTINREHAVEKFTSGQADMFLISLKAGGVGLNLVEADTVIHYDPWWNPAVENQATDRAYRIGQKKAVFVYKLIVENTIEQKILELQEKKRVLQDGIFDENKQQEDTKFTGDDLLELLK
jgi:SNF2 family DNA or RNA helicase